jgi:hypothetical protein
MAFPVFLASVVFAAGVSAKAPQSPETRFAERVSLRAQAGWHLRAVTVDDARQTTSLTLTLQSPAGGEAERFELRFDEGEGRFESFAWQSLGKPILEAREYDFEAELYESLQHGAPLALDPGCVDYFLEFRGRSVALDSEGYTVQVATEEHRAGEAVSGWLAELLEDGELVDVRDERDDNGAEVKASAVLVVNGDQGPHTITAELDGRGMITAAELRYAPGLAAYRAYQKPRALGKALLKGRAVESMRFVMDSWEATARLELTMQSGLAVIDFADFQERGVDEDDFCGC